MPFQLKKTKALPLFQIKREASQPSCQADTLYYVIVYILTVQV
ncbi:hypothetical protein EV200_103215 [Pedobacter psychrotolerans]|uniref:Uncharacterized protein n=1 Tax=Pedobacter psychrotolerans TaxID=1843235 RepID=A0A4R2HIT8_9SPHI|nr:hypothetical protein EV200_103215 [Pedobacter psychrotolerans]